MSNNSQQDHETRFAPELFFKNVAAAIDFYKTAFNAEELRSWKNADETVHVAEMAIKGAMFHLHEEVSKNSELSPETLNGTPVVIGLFVNEPDALFSQALQAGATETEPMQDYDYGYRQGSLTDPFKHHWVIQKKL